MSSNNFRSLPRAPFVFDFYSVSEILHCVFPFELISRVCFPLSSFGLFNSLGGVSAKYVISSFRFVLKGPLDFYSVSEMLHSVISVAIPVISHVGFLRGRIAYPLGGVLAKYVVKPL